MTPTQVAVRFPAEVGRAWSFRPVGTPPRVGAITPRPFGFAPDAAETADGTFEVALLATDSSWAWQVRDPDNVKRTVAVTGSGPVAYAALADVDAADPASIAAPTFTPAAAPAATTLEQTPLWLLDVVRDLARRQADLESRVGTPAGMTPIGTTDDAVDAYINGFINPLIGDYL